MTPDTNRLLLVDDASNLDMLSRLTRQGYSVEVAEDGPSALEMIRRYHYDLVLLEYMMPGMTGLDLLRLLRATYSRSELPVIMVAAEGQSGRVVEALDQGANDYVVKPVDMPMITARIQAQLSRSRAERRVKRSDPLTGLNNRAQLMDCMASAIAGSAGRSAALLLLDLDGFKGVNDSFGHGTGDELLLEMGARLTQLVADHGLRDSSTIARIGGDEFVVLIERVKDDKPLRALAEAIRRSLNDPILIRGRSVPISARMGIALSADQRTTPETLLRDADLAMARAKELGKNRWHVFDDSLRERAEARMSIALDLRHAVERAELVAVYQPEFNLTTRAILGFEALLRWQHPRRGLLGPGEFIPVAEDTGLIVPIGDWILVEACRQHKTWQTRYPASPPLTMSVNLSVKQLAAPNLVDRVRTVMEEAGVAPETLKLELTESSLMTEVESAEQVLAGLRAMRIGLKLDDFGTGYSSLGYLRRLHFDSLKIDRSFVSRLETDPDCLPLIETMIHLARALHMGVVAEGIETEWQLAELVRLGCERGQGFYFSKPLPAEEAEQLLRDGLRINAAGPGVEENTGKELQPNFV